MEILIQVLPDQDRPGRRALLAEWIGQLPAGPLLEDLREQMALAEPGLTNCHSVALSLIINLHKAGKGRGVRLVSGYVGQGECRVHHSWIEADGWAADGSAGSFIVTRADFYRAQKHADVRASMSAEQVTLALRLRGKADGGLPWGPATLQPTVDALRFSRG